MLKKRLDKRCLGIILHYGPVKQQRKLAEEQFELQQAITEVELRDQNHLREISEYQQDILIDEIADNLVMLAQYIQYYDLPIEKIDERMDYKLDRQEERIANEIHGNKQNRLN